MKIYTKIVMNWDGDEVESESYDYDGPVSLCKGGGKGGVTTPEVVQPATKAATKDVSAAMTAAREAQQQAAAKKAGTRASILTSDSSGNVAKDNVAPDKKTLLGQ